MCLEPGTMLIDISAIQRKSSLLTPLGAYKLPEVSISVSSSLIP
jgi:hypothetical protein